MPKYRSNTRNGSPPQATTRYRGAIVWLAVWSLLRLPVAVPDFHEVAHHHADGAECLYHEHLNRWHEDGSQSSPERASHVRHDPARLHWHWVIPGTSVPEGDSEPLDRTGETLIGLSVSTSPGTDSLSRMLESANQAVIVKHAAVDRSERDRAFAFSFPDSCFRVSPSLRHEHRRFRTTNVETAAPGMLSFAPLRC